MSSAIAVLFDSPGPRARRRIRIAGAVCVTAVVVLALLALGRLAGNGQLDAARWSMFTRLPVLRFLLDGLFATLQVTAISAAIAFPLGALVALARMSLRRAVRQAARGYVELFRAVPLLLWLYISLFALPKTGMTLPVFWQLAGPIAVSQAAVIAEIARAGLLAVPIGQSEAAAGLGLGHWQAMRLVVVPQALRPVAPALVSQLVRVMKDSTLGYVVSFTELLHQAKVLGEYEHNLLPTYLVTAAVYVAINIALSSVATAVKERLSVPSARRRRGHRRAIERTARA